MFFSGVPIIKGQLQKVTFAALLAGEMRIVKLKHHFIVMVLYGGSLAAERKSAFALDSSKK